MYLVQVGRVYFCAVFNAGIVTGVLRVTKRANGSNLFRRVSRPFAFCNFTPVRTIRYTLFIRYDCLLALNMHTELFIKDIIFTNASFKIVIMFVSLIFILIILKSSTDFDVLSYNIMVILRRTVKQDYFCQKRSRS